MITLEQQVDALMRLCAADQEGDREVLRSQVRGYLEHKQRSAVFQDPEYQARQLLLELGAPDHLVGHPYAVEAIVLVVEDRTYINNITFGLYPQLAAHFDTTAARVERAIRHLVEVTWLRADLEVLNRYFGGVVRADRGKPTNGEFIARLANVVKQRIKEAS